MKKYVNVNNSFSYNTKNLQGTSYQFIVSDLQIYPSLPCFMLLYLNPINISYACWWDIVSLVEGITVQ